jgi:hypothetical protein
MPVRIFLGGVVGGVLVFFVGALCHAGLELQSRTMHPVSDEAGFTEHLKAQQLEPGFYVFPEMPRDTPKEKQAEVYEQLNARYKAGPAGLMIIAPTGQDMMNGETLFKEFVSNLLAALIVSWVLSLMAVDVGFGRRYVAVVMMGVFAWFSLTASYGIWYRFPHDFVHDELYAVLLEWGVAGLAMAAIVRRRPAVPTTVEVKG